MPNRVPFFSFDLAPETLKDEWRHAISLVISNGQFIGGELVSTFETSWAKTIGTKYAIGVGNGLDGLVIALKALNIGPGNSVALPVHTFIATWNAVKLAGANPIAVDVDEKGLLNLDLLESLNDIDCVIPVHMHGLMVNMERLNNWANRTGVSVIEDASQSHLAKIGDNYAGSFGDIGVFSLYPSKNLGAIGDAGIISTNDHTLANSIRSYSNYGSDIQEKYRHVSFGTNSRLDTIQAAVLQVNLKYLESWIEHRKMLAGIYLDKLMPSNKFVLLHNDTQSSVWHHFPILCSNRDKLRTYLLSCGIHTEIHYPNLAATEYNEIIGNPTTEYLTGLKIAKSILSLPISQWHSTSDIEYVIEMLNGFSSEI